MSSFEIRHSDFPKALPRHLTVGDEIELRVTCRIAGIREEQIDVSNFDTESGRARFQTCPGDRFTDLILVKVQAS